MKQSKMSLKSSNKALILIALLALVIALVLAIYQRSTYIKASGEDGMHLDYHVTLANRSSIFPTMLSEESFTELERAPIILKVEASGKNQIRTNAIVQEVRVKDVIKGEGIDSGQSIYLTSHVQIVDYFTETVILFYHNLMQEGYEYLVFIEEEIQSPFSKDEGTYLIMTHMPSAFFVYGDVDDHILVGDIKEEVTEDSYFMRIKMRDIKDAFFLSEEQDLLDEYHRFRHELIRHFDSNYQIP